MLTLFNKETLVKLKDFPQSSIGAPCPIVLASENSVVVLFYVEEAPKSMLSTSIDVQDIENQNELLAIVTLQHCTIHLFGSPNDETISGHRLYKQGLMSYSAFQLEQSTWITDLERKNSVHSHHNREQYLADKKHYIFTFHDSTFECIAHGYSIQYEQGSIREALLRITNLLTN